MYHQVFPTKRKPKLYPQPAKTLTPLSVAPPISPSQPLGAATSGPPPSPPANKTIFDEAQRRDRIIRKLNAEVPYKAGDRVITVDPMKREEYGEMQVMHILPSYALYGKDEKWPDHDNPMIVTAKRLNNDSIITCTTNFIQKK